MRTVVACCIRDDAYEVRSDKKTTHWLDLDGTENRLAALFSVSFCGICERVMYALLVRKTETTKKTLNVIVYPNRVDPILVARIKRILLSH
jgi:hypothetical protein